MRWIGSRWSVVGALVGLVALAVAIAVGSASAAGERPTEDAEFDVTMGKPTELAMKLSSASGKAGEVALVVRNKGKITHEFILLRTNTKAANLKPRAEDPSKVVEPGFLLELEDVESKDRVTVVTNMKKGHYVVLCNIEGHYAGGMRADLTLK